MLNKYQKGCSFCLFFAEFETKNKLNNGNHLKRVVSWSPLVHLPWLFPQQRKCHSCTRHKTHLLCYHFYKNMTTTGSYPAFFFVILFHHQRQKGEVWVGERARKTCSLLPWSGPKQLILCVCVCVCVLCMCKIRAPAALNPAPSGQGRGRAD